MDAAGGEYANSIWSDREFDFDDLIVNSQAYRRALAATRAGRTLAREAKDQSSGPSTQPAEFDGDLIDLSDAATITQQAFQQPLVDDAASDLQGLVLTDIQAKINGLQVTGPLANNNEPAPQSNSKSIAAPLMKQPSFNTYSVKSPPPGPSSPDNNTLPPHRTGQTEEEKLGLVRRKPVQPPVPKPVPTPAKTPADVSLPSQTRRCDKCKLALTGQFVRALGGTYHLDCFTCEVCQTYHLRLPTC